MTLQEQFKNETGIDATHEIQLYEGESSVIYGDDYVKWLENKIKSTQEEV